MKLNKAEAWKIRLDQITTCNLHSSRCPHTNAITISRYWQLNISTGKPVPASLC